MLKKRLAILILLTLNAVLILFILFRSGSAVAPVGGGSTVPLRITNLAALEPKPDTLILNDFEIAPDLVNMYRQGGEFTMTIIASHATHGRHALLFEKKNEANIEVATIDFPRNWQGYQRLEFDVYNGGGTPGTIWLRVGSQYDSRRFYVKSQKFARAFPLKPGANTVVVPLEDIRRAFGQLPKNKSLHFNIPAQGGETLYLDFVRLVRDDV
jgi:hypothetical protein